MNTDNNKLSDNEMPSGSSYNDSDNLMHGKVSIQPLHSDVIPEDTPIEPETKYENVDTEIAKGNSIIDNLQGSKISTLNSLPRYQREADAPKSKHFYGLYALAIILVVNAFDIFLISTALSGDAANFVRFLSAIGLLLGIGLLMRKESARIMTIALFLFLAILSFGLLKKILFAGIIIYLCTPRVKEEFES